MSSSQIEAFMEIPQMSRDVSQIIDLEFVDELLLKRLIENTKSDITTLQLSQSCIDLYNSDGSLDKYQGALTDSW